MPAFEYDYPVEDFQLLLNLLKQWKLECLYQILIGNIKILT